MNISTTSFHKLTTTWFMLKIAYGTMALAAGIDKLLKTTFFANWAHYINNSIAQIIPMDMILFMQLIGVVEIVVGILVLSKFTRLGAYIASAWLITIAINLAIGHQFCDIVVRDLVLAVGAFALAKLTEIHHELKHQNV